MAERSPEPSSAANGNANNTSAAANSEIDEVDAISTVALLIDDLSSEDPNAKMHSI